MFHRVISELAATTNVCLSTQVQEVIFWEAQTCSGSSCLFYLVLTTAVLAKHSKKCWSEGEIRERWGASFFFILNESSKLRSLALRMNAFVSVYIKALFSLMNQQRDSTRS